MPKKKIFDITPPAPKPGFKPRVRGLKPGFKPSLRKKTPILITIGVILIISGLSWIFIEPKLTIEIWPKIETQEFKTRAQISGEIFQIEKSLSQDFSATGQKLKEEKAKGTIRVYNNYSATAQPLIATTRFLSNDGKLFRTPKGVVIPGAPGSIDIEVVADQPGEDYNIGPSTFSIPGFAGTAKYTAFYAKSFEPMQGGMKRQVSLVTREDLDRARDALTAKILEETKTSLEDSIPSGEYIFLEKAFTQEIIEFKSLAEVGKETETFTCESRAVARVLAPKESELKAFAQNYILSQIPQEKEFNPASLQIRYSFSNINIDKKEITLDLEMSAEIYSGIDENSLKEVVRNKHPEEIKIILKDFPEIERAQVELWPFWASGAPEDPKRIEVKLSLD